MKIYFRATAVLCFGLLLGCSEPLTTREKGAAIGTVGVPPLAESSAMRSAILPPVPPSVPGLVWARAR